MFEKSAESYKSKDSVRYGLSTECVTYNTVKQSDSCHTNVKLWHILHYL
jgi:hypothetical protein